MIDLISANIQVLTPLILWSYKSIERKFRNLKKSFIKRKEKKRKRKKEDKEKRKKKKKKEKENQSNPLPMQPF